MPRSRPALEQTVAQVLACVPPVVADIQARPDYLKNTPLFDADVGSLQELKQALLNANLCLSPIALTELKDRAEFTVLPLLEKWVAANLAISKMGPLNTHRSIPPSLARRHNVNLAALQNAVQLLLAQLSAACCPPIPPPGPCPPPFPPCPPPPCPPPLPPKARLLRLEVDAAAAIGGEHYVAEYAPGKAVTVRGIVDPPLPAVYAGLIWQGGEPTCCNDSRLLSRDSITRAGEPEVVCVWLGDTRLRVWVTVRPLFGGFDVGNAVQSGERWIALYSADGDPVTVRAAMLPDVPEAYRYLVWEGGCIDAEHPDDRRLVPRSAVTPLGLPVSVSAMFNPKRQVLIEVVPLFKALIVSVGDIQLAPEGKTSLYTVAYGDGSIVLSAETEPADLEVWTRIVWTGNAGEGGSPNCKVLPRNVLTPLGQSGRTITAKLGNTLHSATVKVVPSLVALAVAGSNGMIFPEVRAGNVFDYTVPYIEGQVLSVSAATYPEDAGAWDYIAWSGDGSAGGARNRRTLTRTALTPFGKAGRAVTAGVGGVTLTARITIVPTLSALTVPVYGFEAGTPRQWCSYRLANPNLFDLSEPFPKAVVRAVTVPDNGAAWAYISWSDNGNPGQVEAGADARLRTVRLDCANTVMLAAAIGNQQVAAQLEIRAPRQESANGLQLALNTIRFSGGRAVTIDYRTGSTLPALRYLGHFPRIWRRTNPGSAAEYPQRVLYQPPQAYTRSTSIGLAAELDIVHRADADTAKVLVRASAFLRRSGGEACRLVWQQEVEIPSADAGPVVFPAVNSRNLPDVVLHEGQLLVFWEVCTEAENWILFDVSEHMLYVTYGDPVAAECRTLNDPAAGGAAYTLWSMLDISCAAGKEAGAISHAVQGIYRAFQPPAPNPKLRRKHDGMPFKYWGATQEVAQQLTARNGVVDPQLFIANGSGSSLSFAQMLLSMFAVHGIVGAGLIEVRPNPAVSPEAVRFLVHTWAFNLMPRPSGSGYSHHKRNDGTAPNPLFPAGWATWTAGTGQNSDRPPPALLSHYLVWLNQSGINLFFDPSYGGIPETTWQAWVKATVSGLERSQAHLPPDKWYRFLLPAEPVPPANAGFVKQGPAFPAQAPDNLVKLTLVADHSELN